jgi:hypothetical protein
VTWREIPLTRPPLTLEFGPGDRAELAVRNRRTAGGDFSADLLVTVRKGLSIELRDVVDDGETTLGTRVFAVQGSAPDRLFLIGGPTAYRISSAGAVERKVDLLRRWQDAEHWTTELVTVTAGLLIVYEAGVLLLTDELDLRWHQAKYFNDTLARVEDDVAVFVRDHDQEWRVSLKDGAQLS